MRDLGLPWLVPTPEVSPTTPPRRRVQRGCGKPRDLADERSDLPVSAPNPKFMVIDRVVHAHAAHGGVQVVIGGVEHAGQALRVAEVRAAVLVRRAVLVERQAAGAILCSMRHQDWIIAIDASTGDVLWRLGEDGDFTLTAGTWPYHQHSPQWQDDGTLLLYDNGLGNPAVDDALETSRAVRYAVDTDAMTVTEVWEDEAEDFLAPIGGDADRLPDGSMLVTDSSIDLGDGFDATHARIREIDERSSAAPSWSITTEPGSFVYRAIPLDRLPGE